ncbi:hypothetical protein DAPPUDRAFT_342501, partial [Daphnia pulex]
MEATELYAPNYHRKQLKVHDNSSVGAACPDQTTTTTEEEDELLLLQQQQQDDRTHISRLYPEILAIIFGMLEVRDRGRAAQ